MRGEASTHRGRTIAGLERLEALPLQIVRDELHDVWLIVDDEDLRLRFLLFQCR